MRRTLAVLLALAVLAVAGFIYYAIDPASSPLFPRCGFLTLTGYKCPGCGSQRAIHALLGGQVVEAFKYNAMLFIATPWLLLCLYAEAQRTRNPQRYARLHSSTLIWIFLAMVVVWWVLRNLCGW